MTRVQVNRAEMARLAQDPAIREFAERQADTGARDAAAGAPRRTGRGAASISGRVEFRDGRWAILFGPDRAHAYLRFPEHGTRYMPGQHFMRRAGQRLAGGR